MIPDDVHIRRAREDTIDAIVADSFPASDPPSWTPTTAQLNPVPSDPCITSDTGVETLQPGDLLPHFTVTDLAGNRVDYSSIWQRRNLVLVMLHDSGPSSASYAERLRLRSLDTQTEDTVWLVTRDRIAGLPCPGAIVVDRWGELIHLAHGPDTASLPAPDELAEWAEYVRHRCPECEGESR